MTQILEVGGRNLAVVIGLMLLLWLVSLVKRDSSIVDPFWGAGFVVIAWMTFLWTDGEAAGWRAAMIVGLTTAWGVRLSVFLQWRNWGQPEDFRYAAMREKHGPRYPIVSLLTVFLLQGVLMWIVSWPVQFGQLGAGGSLKMLDIFGVLLWAVGLVFESVGDYQLTRFKSDPTNRGKVLETGLWRYTRHPNYFGDFCVWWGLYLVATGAGAWWTAVGPLLMSYLLLRFSGVAHLERTIVERRPEYRAYIERTNAFFPGRPREG